MRKVDVANSYLLHLLHKPFHIENSLELGLLTEPAITGACLKDHLRVLLASRGSAQSLQSVLFFVAPWTIYSLPGKNTGAGCHFLLQGIFLIQGLNMLLFHHRWILYH